MKREGFLKGLYVYNSGGFKMKQEITKEIKEALKQFFWTDDEGKTKVNLGNCRLDFEKSYYFDKFTKKGVKMHWINGTNKVPVIGCVEQSREYGDFAFYTESWSYIEHFKINKKEAQK